MNDRSPNDRTDSLLDSWKTACRSNLNMFPGLPLTNDTDIMERWQIFDDVYANMKIEML